MIRKIAVTNFLSILDRQEISFEVSGNAPDTTAYYTSASGTRIGKLLVCFGHNASGKTNLLRAFEFLRALICDSFSWKPEDDLPLQTHALSQERATVFSAEFETETESFSYTVAMTQGRILAEELWSKGFSPHSRKKVCFTRKWDEQGGAYDLRDVEFQTPEELEASRKRENASFISIAASASSKLATAIRELWLRCSANFNNFGREQGNVFSLMSTARKYQQRKEYLDAAQKLLLSFDIGFEGLELAEHDVPDMHAAQKPKKQIIPYGVHEAAGKLMVLPLFLESEGTQNLFVHLYRILTVLDTGGLAVIDELDADLHPLMVPRLLDLFTSPTTNPHNAQLICACHSAPVMNHLDKYQILLVEKDQNLATQVWRLDDMEGVRVDENYYAKYMAGAYGAVPDFKG